MFATHSKIKCCRILNFFLRQYNKGADQAADVQAGLPFCCSNAKKLGFLTTPMGFVMKNQSSSKFHTKHVLIYRPAKSLKIWMLHI